MTFEKRWNTNAQKGNQLAKWIVQGVPRALVPGFKPRHSNYFFEYEITTKMQTLKNIVHCGNAVRYVGATRQRSRRNTCFPCYRSHTSLRTTDTFCLVHVRSAILLAISVDKAARLIRVAPTPTVRRRTAYRRCKSASYGEGFCSFIANFRLKWSYFSGTSPFKGAQRPNNILMIYQCMLPAFLT